MEPIIINRYVPFNRVEESDSSVVVEGYAFVNQRVESDPWNLLRSAMEEATAEYLKFPAIREMHQPSAAGVGLSVTWDEKGAFIRAEIVDPVAIEKVRKGVYRGFSVGVRPLVLRGEDVVKAKWSETSLVDRPADPDAIMSLGRVEDDADVSPVMLRASFAEIAKAEAPNALRSWASSWLWDSLWSIVNGSYGDKSELIRATCTEFADFMCNAVANPELMIGLDPETERSESEPTIQRLQSENATHQANVQRLENELGELNAKLERASTDLAASQAAHKELLNKPMPKPVMANDFSGIDRQFLFDQNNARNDAVQRLQQELIDLVDNSAPESSDARIKRADRISQVKLELNRLGVDPVR
jgi:hypothetical protein